MFSNQLNARELFANSHSSSERHDYKEQSENSSQLQNSQLDFTQYSQDMSMYNSQQLSANSQSESQGRRLFDRYISKLPVYNNNSTSTHAKAPSHAPPPPQQHGQGKQSSQPAAPQNNRPATSRLSYQQQTDINKAKAKERDERDLLNSIVTIVKDCSDEIKQTLSTVSNTLDQQLCTSDDKLGTTVNGLIDELQTNYGKILTAIEERDDRRAKIHELEMKVSVKDARIQELQSRVEELRKQADDRVVDMLKDTLVEQQNLTEKKLQQILDTANDQLTAQKTQASVQQQLAEEQGKQYKDLKMLSQKQSFDVEKSILEELVNLRSDFEQRTVGLERYFRSELHTIHQKQTRELEHQMKSAFDTNNHMSIQLSSQQLQELYQKQRKEMEKFIQSQMTKQTQVQNQLQQQVLQEHQQQICQHLKEDLSKIPHISQQQICQQLKDDLSKVSQISQQEICQQLTKELSKVQQISKQQICQQMTEELSKVQQISKQQICQPLKEGLSKDLPVHQTSDVTRSKEGNPWNNNHNVPKNVQDQLEALHQRHTQELENLQKEFQEDPSHTRSNLSTTDTASKVICEQNMSRAPFANIYNTLESNDLHNEQNDYQHGDNSVGRQQNQPRVCYSSEGRTQNQSTICYSSNGRGITKQNQFAGCYSSDGKLQNQSSVCHSSAMSKRTTFVSPTIPKNSTWNSRTLFGRTNPSPMATVLPQRQGNARIIEAPVGPRSSSNVGVAEGVDETSQESSRKIKKPRWSSATKETDITSANQCQSQRRRSQRISAATDRQSSGDSEESIGERVEFSQEMSIASQPSKSLPQQLKSVSRSHKSVPQPPKYGSQPPKYGSQPPKSVPQPLKYMSQQSKPVPQPPKYISKPQKSVPPKTKSVYDFDDEAASPEKIQPWGRFQDTNQGGNQYNTSSARLRNGDSVTKRNQETSGSLWSRGDNGQCDDSGDSSPSLSVTEVVIRRKVKGRRTPDDMSVCNGVTSLFNDFRQTYSPKRTDNRVQASDDFLSTPNLTRPGYSERQNYQLMGSTSVRRAGEKRKLYDYDVDTEVMEITQSIRQHLLKKRQ